MNIKKISNTFKETAILIGLVAFGGGLLIFPRQVSFACTQGLSICVNSIFPSLFPFFILSNMVIDTGLVERASLFLSPFAKRIFGISGRGFSAFLLGILGGYPVGAKTTVALYEKGLCSKQEAQRLLCFCNNSGPAFILGVVGISLFGSVKIGAMLYFCHVLSSVILGIMLKLLFGNVKQIYISKNTKDKKGFVQSFITSVSSSVNSIIAVSSFVIFFGVFIAILKEGKMIFMLEQVITVIFGDFLRENNLLTGLITGFFELANGLENLRNVDFYAGVTMSAFLIGWAGMSVHFQTMNFVSGSGLSSKSYFLSKLCQGGISAMLMWLYFSAFPTAQNVFYYEYPYFYGYDVTFAKQFFVANLICTTVFMIFVLLAYFSIEFLNKKRYNKKKGQEDENDLQ